jgi:hypothetical protein
VGIPRAATPADTTTKHITYTRPVRAMYLRL